MAFSSGFYALNLAYAWRIQSVTGIPLESALRQYTNLFIRFGLGNSLEPNQPIWREFIAGLVGGSQDVELAYQFGRRYGCPREAGASRATFGCFSYTVWDGTRLRLHFHNNEVTDTSPLSEERRATRQEELCKMFSFVRKNDSKLETVVGGSWLYYLEGYRRLFPLAFLSTARQGAEDYPYLTLWGQFLDRHGEVRPGPAQQFMEGLERQTTLAGLLDCFPLKVQYLEAPLGIFYDYYDSKCLGQGTSGNGI